MRSLLFCAILLTAFATSAVAGPADAELRAYRALVPDYSKTSGGVSPAVSPDGRSLAYYSGAGGETVTGDVCIITGLDNWDGSSQASPWLLGYHPLDTGWSPAEIPQRENQTRDIDWSPDSKRLAFVGKGGHLYAEGLDLAAKKTGEVRVLAISGASKDDPTATIRSPRWSPDGKRIVFIRSRTDRPATVCVLEVATGNETIVGEGAVDDPVVWGQPWSPDGEYVVYTAGNYTADSPSFWLTLGSSESSETDCHLVVASADGKKRHMLSSIGPAAAPSWSPVGDRIAFSAVVGYSFDLALGYRCGVRTAVIRTSSSDGKDIKSLTAPALPSREDMQKDISARLEAFEELARVEFEKRYGKKLTPSQLADLKQGKMRSPEMIKVAASIVAKEMGVSLPIKPGSMSKEDAAELSAKLSSALTKATEFMALLFAQTLDPPTAVLGPMTKDLFPLWSPDGQRMTYLCLGGDYSSNRLVIRDLRSGKSRTLFDRAGIECVSWTGDGKLLAVQARRLMSVRESDGHEVSSACNVSSTCGYPEVWLLEPRE